MCKHILFNNFNYKSDIKSLKTFIEKTNENDGYGAIVRTIHGKIETLKSLSEGAFYIDLMKRLSSGDVQTLVVHHRTSTNLGGLDYAHPFEFKGHHMTHNGVVSVPGKHDTKTTNDSEELLHHLVKTNWNTEEVSGYFSCFVLTEAETRVIVDDTAPMFSDGRVYCSHRLGDSFSKVSLKHIVHDNSGQRTHQSTIQVTKSDYGKNKAHLSLSGTPRGWEEDWRYYSDDHSGGELDDCEASDKFLAIASDYVLEDLFRSVDSVKFYSKLHDYSEHYGLSLDAYDAQEVRDFLLGVAGSPDEQSFSHIKYNS